MIFKEMNLTILDIQQDWHLEPTDSFSVLVFEELWSLKIETPNIEKDIFINKMILAQITIFVELLCVPIVGEIYRFNDLNSKLTKLCLLSDYLSLGYTRFRSSTKLSKYEMKELSNCVESYIEKMKLSDFLGTDMAKKFLFQCYLTNLRMKFCK